MTKKNFKGINPVLSYISNPEGKDKEPQQVITDVFKDDNEATDIADILKDQEQEPRSKRYNLLMRPSIFKGLQEQAKRHDTSVNNLINIFIERGLEDLK